MKTIKSFYIILLSTTLFACQNRDQKTSKNAYSDVAVKTDSDHDSRPKEEISFLNRVKAESDYEVTSNAVKKDAHIKAFNKYSLDSLKNIKDWEFTVTEINDASSDANSFIKMLGDLDNNQIYNLVLVAPIKIDNSVDSVAIDNRVDFTYTIPKNPKNAVLIKQLSILKTLQKGDVVIVSGALTHLDDNSKVNFESFYDQYGPWNVDLLLTDIRKKADKK